MEKRIGIIIPTYNRPILLKRALLSVFEQSYTNWILYIVNDGGEVRDIEILVNYCKKKYNCKNNITIHNNAHNLGKAASCNIALKKTESELVIILNDDDTWASEFLQASINQLEYRNKLNPLLKGITCLSNIYHEEILDEGHYTQWCETPSEHNLRNFDDYIPASTIIKQNVFSSSQFVFYKDVIEKIGVFNETMLVYSDWEFNIRFVAYFDIYRQTQPFANIYKRFYCVNPSYINLITLHDHKLDYYSNKINDSLLRLTVMSNLENNNNTHQITFQTLLLMRKSSDNTPIAYTNYLPNQTLDRLHNTNYLSNQILDRLHNMENIINNHSKLNIDWFKYLEYKLKNPFFRKSIKALHYTKDYLKKIFASL